MNPSHGDPLPSRRRDPGRRPPQLRPDGGGQPVSVQEALTLLSNPTTRSVLFALREADGPLELRELARVVAARQRDTDTAAISAVEVERSLTVLHHLTLPSLQSAGLVTTDGTAVELVDERPTIRALLDTIERVGR